MIFRKSPRSCSLITECPPVWVGISPFLPPDMEKSDPVWASWGLLPTYVQAGYRNEISHPHIPWNLIWEAFPEHDMDKSSRNLTLEKDYHHAKDLPRSTGRKQPVLITPECKISKKIHRANLTGCKCCRILHPLATRQKMVKRKLA